ncbi:MAG: 4-hydroxythreonine-4-phosphate dehydrogenase PdxA [Proteobacteria bacterium]|nr:4-hydroxythreonine-4-phosphate dehydrogenase PdxA [Pseudomonadota bacterium]
MISISQGHEKGIGLEVLFKSLSLLPQSSHHKIKLYAFKKSVKNTLQKLDLDYELGDDGVYFQWGKLNVEWLPTTSLPQSTVSFIEAIEECRQNNGVLFTLPTTKDHLVNPKKKSEKLLGHTEFLRSYFKQPLLGMYFHSDSLRCLLLTDHLPLRQMLETLTPVFAKKKLEFSLKALQKLEPDVKRVVVAGLNPHSGEGGLLGKEDARIEKAIHSLKIKGMKIEGLFSGDTLLNQLKSQTDLLVYQYHDQGLGVFKGLMGTLGANITLGLPFTRLSVDHGTAFSLYGKNVADYRGALYCLNKALEYQERLRGQDSSYKGKSTQSKVD